MDISLDNSSPGNSAGPCPEILETLGEGHKECSEIQLFLVVVLLISDCSLHFRRGPHPPTWREELGA